jgi:hypothetical protein
MGPFFSFISLHYLLVVFAMLFLISNSLHPLLRDGVMRRLPGSSFEDQPQERRNVHTVSPQIALLLY